MEMWRGGDLERWRFGEVETGRGGDLAMWRTPDPASDVGTPGLQRRRVLRVNETEGGSLSAVDQASREWRGRQSWSTRARRERVIQGVAGR